MTEPTMDDTHTDSDPEIVDADASAPTDSPAEQTAEAAIVTEPLPASEAPAAYSLPGDSLTTSTKPPKRRGRAVSLGILVAFLGFGGGVAGFVVADQISSDDSSASAVPAQPSNAVIDDAPVKTADGDEGMTPREIYSRVAPAVVHIDSRSTEKSTSIFGIPQEEEVEGTGSGFVIDTDGHIVTNAHVVQDTTDLKVSFGDDVTVPAKLVGLDKSTDVAVIKVDPDSKELEGELRTVEFGDSDAISVGDPVLAIGNPFSLDRTLTTGVVSALQRTIPGLNDFPISGAIQTDAAVNPGNSGGPLLNTAGEVIGVNSQIQSKGGGFDGIAFAVPSSTVKKIANDLIKDGEVNHAWLGVAGNDVTPAIADALNLEVESGVIIGQVTDGSPADKAGIKGGREDMVIEGTGVRPGGDIITKFNGEDITTMRQLASAVEKLNPGDEAKVEFRRGDDTKTVTIKLAERPDDLGSNDD